MNDSNTTCGCRGCAQGYNCGCQAVEMESQAQAAVCACGNHCDCSPCRCTDVA